MDLRRWVARNEEEKQKRHVKNSCPGDKLGPNSERTQTLGSQK